MPGQEFRGTGGVGCGRGISFLIKGIVVELDTVVCDPAAGDVDIKDIWFVVFVDGAVGQPAVELGQY